MFGWLLLLFTGVPMLELALLIEVGRAIGLLPTLALVLGTGATGAWLARWQGVRALRAVQQEMASGRVPGESLLDGLLILVGAVLLITPGVLTDLVGLSLLIPVTRHALRALVRRWAEKHVRVVHFQSAPGPVPRYGPGPVIDAEVVPPSEPSAGDAPRDHDPAPKS